MCLVEELLWQYVDAVSSMKANFSSFCSLVETDYTRNGSFRKFVSAKTFSKTFFSWASHQSREFRKSCHWCGNQPKVLACDGTKIGIMQLNLAIDDPLDKPFGEDIATKERRMGRCFLQYPKKMKDETVKEHQKREAAVRDGRAFLKYLTKKKDEKEKPVFTELEAQARRSALFDIFPMSCKTLLQRFLDEQLSPSQMNTTRSVLYLLSYEAPIRTFLPSALAPSLVNFLQRFLDEQLSSSQMNTTRSVLYL